MPKEWSDSDLKGNLDSRKTELKGLLDKIENGNFMNYGVILGAILVSIPSMILLKCFCAPGKGINWDERIEKLKSDVRREEKIFDKELKKVMDERKSLTASLEKLEGGKYNVTDLLEGKYSNDNDE